MNVAPTVPTVTHAPTDTASLTEKVSINNLEFFYGDSRALKSVSLPLYRNKVTAFIRLRQVDIAARAQPDVRPLPQSARRGTGSARW
jgi:hypothetical protein